MSVALETFADGGALASAAADLVARAVTDDPDAALLLPAGRTPVPLYAELVRRCRAGTLDLSRAHLFQLDEMVGVPESDARSFATFLRRHLLDAVERAPGRDHLLRGDAPDPAVEIATHAAALAAQGGADLALLGLGRNGHVAFNEPGSPADGRARVVALDEATRAGLGDSDGDTPTHGMTLGLAEIAAARHVAVLVTGTSKRDVLGRLLDGPPSPGLPASLLAGHPGLTVLADAAAAPAAGQRNA